MYLVDHREAKIFISTATQVLLVYSLCLTSDACHNWWLQTNK